MGKVLFIGLGVSDAAGEGLARALSPLQTEAVVTILAPSMELLRNGCYSLTKGEMPQESYS